MAHSRDRRCVSHPLGVSETTAPLQDGPHGSGESSGASLPPRSQAPGHDQQVWASSRFVATQPRFLLALSLLASRPLASRQQAAPRRLLIGNVLALSCRLLPYREILSLTLRWGWEAG